MKRCDFIAAVISVAAMPFEARGQQNLPRVGMLMSPAESDPETRTRSAALRDALQKLGEVDGTERPARFSRGRRRQRPHQKPPRGTRRARAAPPEIVPKPFEPKTTRPTPSLEVLLLG
jgi:hypothetical protein